MFTDSNTIFKNTTYKVVLPFYLYASFSFLVCTIILFFSAEAFTQHYFHPHVLAVTHIMALGWGTMIILGASHQLVPVLIEGELYSEKLAFCSFALAAIGIPMMGYGFYVFDMGWQIKWGGRFVLLSILCYIINLAVSMARGRTRNVHSFFVLTASLWLFLTAFLGLMLVYNFTYPFLPDNSVEYLPLHAHIGVIGWFLLLVIGVGARLIPMFLISKINNTKLLWVIYLLINSGLILFLFKFLYFPGRSYFLPIGLILLSLLLFGKYCYDAFKQRIRKKIDEQLKLSFVSVGMMLLSIVVIAGIAGWLLTDKGNIQMIVIYGFVIFFGWITAMIFAMTFKTLPYIVWNKVYHKEAGLHITPNPKDLFNNYIFKAMMGFYITGFILFLIGAYLMHITMVNLAAACLIISAVLYIYNVIKIISHKVVKE